MIKFPKTALVLLASTAFVFVACSKKTTVQVDNETQSIVDQVIADQEFISILPAVYQNALSTKGIGTETFTACDTLTFVSGDPTDFSPNPLYSLNISKALCSNTMPDGKIRSGKVFVRLTGQINTVSTQLIIKLAEYTASGISYSCDSMLITTLSASNGIGTFNVKLINGQCKTNGYSIKFDFDRKMTIYTRGTAASYLSGRANGTNRFGLNFASNVTEVSPLVKLKNCAYIVGGIMELTPEGYKQRSVNFGNGECDDKASFTVNENTVAFKLK